MFWRNSGLKDVLTPNTTAPTDLTDQTLEYVFVFSYSLRYTPDLPVLLT